MNSDYDSDRSSAASESRSASPVASFHAPPSVDRLVQHYAAAKRSLTSTNFVFRANQLVTHSRSLLEDIAILNARNTLARRTVDEQAATLHSIKDVITGEGDVAAQEFQSTIKRLDLANDRLETALSALKETVVDFSRHKPAADPPNDTASTVDREASFDASTQHEKTLFDFIDETSHFDLRSSLRNLIDAYHDSGVDINETVQKLDQSLQAIASSLAEGTDRTDNKSPHLGYIYDEPPKAIPQLFRGMEEHTAEMATLLQSLISHYDLCVSALKHTEGGGEAAKKALQRPSDDPAHTVEESLYLKTVPEPISDEQRIEMLRVLENDAQEVNDVVGEIRDRAADVEQLYEQLARRGRAARQTDSQLRHLLTLLHEMKDLHLPAHLHAFNSFKASWKRIRASIESQTAELGSLSSFYESFLSGYANLLREVERRNDARRQMRKVAEKARKELHKLFEADKGMREEFMEEVGRFLPHGIWDGLGDQGFMWEVREIGSEQL